MLMTSVKSRWMGVLAIAVAVTSTSLALADGEKFYKAYYLEHAKGDLSAAAELYSEVVGDHGADRELRSEARGRLAACQEELVSADFARLMPHDAWAYIEINRPGEQLMSLIDQLGLLSDSGSGKAGKKLGISPVIIKELLGVRGAAVAITGFDPARQQPLGVAVFHPGNIEIIRGLIETALPVAAEEVKSIGGFPTYSIEGEVLVTLTKRLVVISTQAAVIDGVIDRLSGDEDRSLATNKDLAGALRGRDDSLIYFCVNAKPIMPLLKAAMAAGGTQSKELAMAQALLDLNSLRSLTGRAGVSDDGLFLDVSLNLDEGHSNLIYNFLRLPPIRRDTLKSIPAGAAWFIAGALNEAPSRFSSDGGESHQKPIVTALDIGREIFANIVSFGVFALPPEGSSPSRGVPIPDIAAVLTVNDTVKSEALWTQILGIASMASCGGPMEGTIDEVEGVEVRGFQMPENITVYFGTVGHDVIISPSKSAISRAIAAKRGGKTILDDKVFASSLKRFGPATTMLLSAHPGRCAQIAKIFMGGNEIPEMEQAIALLTDTVATLTLSHSGESLRFSGTVTGIPDVSDLVTQLVMDMKNGRGRARFASHQSDPSPAPAREAHRADSDRSDSADTHTLLDKFEVLAVDENDREAALAVGKRLVKAAWEDARKLNDFAWVLVTEDRYDGGYNKLALEATKRSNALTDHTNWMYVDTYAHARFALGEVETAVKLEARAVKLAGDNDRRGEAEAALERFKKALEGAKLSVKTPE
ncbi:MAG: hypothetical protein IID33_08610 [Planctomycetes bacterium]|nr:hypothetical protein [Planctomycetota bacterium]